MNSVNYYRRNFGSVEDTLAVPDLISIQLDSYKKFFPITHKSLNSLEGHLFDKVIKSFFPIKSSDGKVIVDCKNVFTGTPKYNILECKERSLTYGLSVYLSLELTIFSENEESGKIEINEIKEQDVYIGDVPLMTPLGTFVTNGIERVVVSQMHRSPGVFFEHDKGKNHASGKLLHFARVIPYRGSWLDFEFDVREIMFVRIDRRKKLNLGILLYALGMDEKSIMSTFYNPVECKKVKKDWIEKVNLNSYIGQIPKEDILNQERETVLKANQRVTRGVIRKAEKTFGIEVEILLNDNNFVGRIFYEDIIDQKTGEVIASIGDIFTEEHLEKLTELDKILFIDRLANKAYIRNTLKAVENIDQTIALTEIYKVMRPGETAGFEMMKEYFDNIFFNNLRYDLSEVGRVKINLRIDTKIDNTVTTLTFDDIIHIIKKLCAIRDGKDFVDDIDHLSNRRVRSVGELLENQTRIALSRLEKVIIERISVEDTSNLVPNDLINSRILTTVMKEFSGLSQLSQFMDQTNPLSEITHKRRISALGPGGLTRDRATFDVRDVHPTHYGRICPIETPEGGNIGLISSMSTYAVVNNYGFMETPYRIVKDGVVTKEIVHLSAIQESGKIIAQPNVTCDENGKILDELVMTRIDSDFVLQSPKNIEFIDISPKQLVSVAASLIPFLETDDGKRALMGANMQRQAVSLVRPDSPIVGTGMEKVVGAGSSSVIKSEVDGQVMSVDANRIVIKALDEHGYSKGVYIYKLDKFSKSNHNTCIHQKPIVSIGQKVSVDEVIADGASTENGELALGANVLVAFMSWNGYNFEDSIVMSERVVKDDVYTSIHIEEFECVARDTRIGAEEITRDIPGVIEENLRLLDETGIVTIGAKVGPGDVLVGKITPKSESSVTAEEKLLRAIFGEKAYDVSDSSLRMPSGTTGTVIDVQILSRRGVEKDQRLLSIERERIEFLDKDRTSTIDILSNDVLERAYNALIGQEYVSALGNKLKKGTEITKEILDNLKDIDIIKILSIQVNDENVNEVISDLASYYKESMKDIQEDFESRVQKLRSGDDMSQGVLKVVRIFVATKSKLQAGDKMAGRHGNKGVVSRVVPIEDMPTLEDGTPVDVVLNPLGVAARMNIGQLLETHLGYACHKIGKQISDMIQVIDDENVENELRNKIIKIVDEKKAKEVKIMSREELLAFAQLLTKKGMLVSSPVFDGASDKKINELLEEAGLDSTGQVNLIDGKTGEFFDRKVTVGYIYILKLHHLVDDKIHARSVGPYSLITQQPLGGKSHFGGQRLGEMECWALEAYGAAYTLQEMLTVKSDDVEGRIRLYEATIKGDNDVTPGIPESFNVLVKELLSLALKVELQE